MENPNIDPLTKIDKNILKLILDNNSAGTRLCDIRYIYDYSDDSIYKTVGKLILCKIIEVEYVDGVVYLFTIKRS